MTKQINEDKINTYFSKFSLLRKTKKALQFFLYEQTTKSLYLRYEIVQKYSKICGKKQNKINWRDLADRVYSEYIRLSECDDRWVWTCITCWHKDFWYNLQNGHYRTRWCLKYRFDDNNCHTQCMRCNVMLNGNYRNYHIWFVDKFWSEYEKKVWEDKEIVDLNIEWYQENILKWYDVIKKSLAKL